MALVRRMADINHSTSGAKALLSARSTMGVMDFHDLPLGEKTPAPTTAARAPVRCAAQRVKSSTTNRYGRGVRRADSRAEKSFFYSCPSYVSYCIESGNSWRIMMVER